MTSKQTSSFFETGFAARATRRARAVLGLRRAETVSRFRRDEDGVAALEFALLALPFLSLLFMILELAIVFYINAALDHATAQATRLVRTGQLQMASNDKSVQEAAYLDSICKSLAAFNDCENKVRVDLVAKKGRFEPNMLPASPRTGPTSPPTTPPSGPVVTSNVPANAFSSSCPGNVVMVRTEFYHNLTIPGKLTYLSNASGNRRVLTSVTAFRNEPYPAQAGQTCPT